LERLIALFLFQQAESAYSSAARVLPAAERAESLQETITEIRCGTTSLFLDQAILQFALVIYLTSAWLYTGKPISVTYTLYGPNADLQLVYSIC
jgi:hypothetical protein